MRFRYLLLITGALLLACNHERILPTDPGPLPPPREGNYWVGSWTFEEATPEDDCMARSLNSQPHTGYAPMTIALVRDGNKVSMEFWAGYDDDVGYLPRVFTGSVDASGRITASPEPYRFQISGGFYCYGDWSVNGGELSGNISEDGSEVSGTITESFRAASDKIFTIRSRFTARAPSRALGLTGEGGRHMVLESPRQVELHEKEKQ